MNRFTKTATTLLLILEHSIALHSQNPGLIITDLQHINTAIRSDSCSNRQLLSNRAMNIFLSEKIGTYLTGFKDVSFYKNSITFNAATGEFSLIHNLFQANGVDEPVRSFNTIGVKANAANALASAFSDKVFKNELGMTINRTWISRPTTVLNDCTEKNLMDGKRGLILKLIEEEIKRKDADFIQSLEKIPQGTLTDAAFSRLKQKLQQDFYAELKDEFSRKFATAQYLELARAAQYKTITTNWTTVNVYLPIILKRFVTAPSLSSVITDKKNYGFELSVGHTRFWETKKLGRLFLKLETSLYLNNSVETHSMKELNYDQYRTAGGEDSSSLSSRKISNIFLGAYRNFLTPAVKFKLIYFPPSSHIGISSSIEKNIGIYKALNLTIGIPVVLINTMGAPAANFEFQVKYFDISHDVFPGKKLGDNISVNLTVGVPFSKIIY
jgi:hypothetical protein